MAYFDHVDPVVEVALGYGPYEDPPYDAWTDITQYVKNLGYERGSRTSEFDQFNAGTMTLELENSDRRFDPLNLASPYVTEDAPSSIFPLVASSATKNGTSLGTSNSMNMPSGISAGDLLIAAIVQDSTTDMTVNSGWELIFEGNGPGSAFRSEVYAKLADGGDTFVVSGATQDYCCTTMRVTNHGCTVGSLASQLGPGPDDINDLTGTSTTPYTYADGTGEGALYIPICFADDDDNVASPWVLMSSEESFVTSTPIDEIALVQSAESTSSVMMMSAWVKLKQLEYTAEFYGSQFYRIIRFNLAATEEHQTLCLTIRPARVDATQLVPNVPIRLYAELDSVTDYVQPTVASSATTSYGGLPQAIALPSGVEQGDLLLALVVQSAAVSANFEEDGWTQLEFDSQIGSTVLRFELYGRIAKGSGLDEGTMNYTGFGVGGAAVVVRVVDHGIEGGTDGLSNLFTGTLATNTSATPSCSITGNGENSLYLAFMGSDDDALDDPFVDSPFAEVAEVEVTDVLSVAVAEDHEITSSSKTASFNLISTESWDAIMVAIPPKKASVWRGVVDAWPVSYTEAGIESTTTVQCTDYFKILAERPCTDEPEEFVKTLDSGVVVYNMDRLEDSQFFPNENADHPRLYTQAKWTESDPITLLADKSFVCPGIRAGEARSPGPPLDGFPMTGQAAINVSSTAAPYNLFGGDEWCLQIALQALGGVESGDAFALFSYNLPPFGDHDTTGGINIIVQYPGRITSASCYVNPGLPSSAVATPVYTGVNAAPAINILDGARHVVTLRRLQDALYLYVDGIQIASGTGLGVVTFSDAQVVGSQMSLMSVAWSAGVAASSMPAMCFGSVVIFPNQGSSELGYDFFFTKNPPVLSGTAINEVLDLIDWPESLRAVDSGTISVRLPSDLHEYNALEALQKIAEAENGRLFIGADGKVTFQDRSSFFGSVEYTFSDTNPNTDVGVYYDALNWVLDDSYVYTGAEITREGGSTRRYSVEDNPGRTRVIDGVWFATDSQAQDLAEWLVYRYAAPQPRTDSYEVDPEAFPSDWPDVLRLDMGTRIVLDITPNGQGSSLDLEQHIEQISGEITPDEWKISFNGVPVDANDYFLWTSSETSDEVHGWSQDGVPPGGAWA